jgi:hypothetical protein
LTQPKNFYFPPKAKFKNTCQIKKIAMDTRHPPARKNIFRVRPKELISFSPRFRTSFLAYERAFNICKKMEMHAQSKTWPLGVQSMQTQFARKHRARELTSAEFRLLSESQTLPELCSVLNRLYQGALYQFMFIQNQMKPDDGASSETGCLECVKMKRWQERAAHKKSDFTLADDGLMTQRRSLYLTPILQHVADKQPTIVPMATILEMAERLNLESLLSRDRLELDDDGVPVKYEREEMPADFSLDHMRHLCVSGFDSPSDRAVILAQLSDENDLYSPIWGRHYLVYLACLAPDKLKPGVACHLIDRETLAPFLTQ